MLLKQISKTKTKKTIFGQEFHSLFLCLSLSFAGTYTHRYKCLRQKDEANAVFIFKKTKLL